MSASEFIPDGGGLKAAREAAAGCRGCHLYEAATQTVFGEDREGHPFVGPAGRELDRALEAAA